MTNISTEMVKNALSKGTSFAAEVFRQACIDTTNRNAEEAFSRAIEIGIENTTTALLDCNTSEDKICDLLTKYWGIPRNEGMKRIRYYRIEILKQICQDYYSLNGTSEIVKDQERMDIIGIIRTHPELWKYHSETIKLYEEIQKIKKQKQK